MPSATSNLPYAQVVAFLVCGLDRVWREISAVTFREWAAALGECPELWDGIKIAAVEKRVPVGACS